MKIVKLFLVAKEATFQNTPFILLAQKPASDYSQRQKRQQQQERATRQNKTFCIKVCTWEPLFVECNDLAHLCFEAFRNLSARAKQTTR